MDNGGNFQVMVFQSFGRSLLLGATIGLLEDTNPCEPGARIMSTSPARLGRALLQFFLKALGFGLPTIGALVAAAGFAFWVMGIPGTSSADYYQNWLLGPIVLGGYIGAYGIYLIAALASVVIRQPWLFYGATAIIWVCLFLASAIVESIWAQMFMQP